MKDQLKKRHRQEAWIERGGEVGQGATTSEETKRTATVERTPDPKPDELDRLWETEWQENLLAAAWQKIKGQFSDRQFQMFDLNVIKGWTAGEVARSLGVRLPSVYLRSIGSQRR